MNIKVIIGRRENADYFGKTIGDTVEVDFEEYIAAVVASEIGNSNIEACKAQAIAARTYVVDSVIRGKTVSDLSSTAQAYRARRYDRSKYPNALAGAEETAGLILTYRGFPIRAVYSANNGGRTLSSEERWGGSGYCYLIAQDDPWDAAAGSGRTGHGVGMSQRGAKYAANNGYQCDEILSFYYPNTVFCPNYGVIDVANVIKDTDLIALFWKAYNEGWGYIWGRYGQIWTEANQKAATRETTVKYGSKWIGKRVADCSGLGYWAFKELGGYLYHGSNTIWNQYVTNKCELKNGKRTDGMEIKPCSPVFLKKKENGQVNRHHIGYYVGIVNGVPTCIEAAGTISGVITSPLSKWHEVAEFKNVSYGGEVPVAYTTMRKGDRGEDVRKLQEGLNTLGYDCGKADGIFGVKTEAAVKKFQHDHALTEDGVAGEQTQRAIEKALNGENSGDQPGNPAKKIISLEDLKVIRERLSAAISIVDRALEGTSV